MLKNYYTIVCYYNLAASLLFCGTAAAQEASMIAPSALQRRLDETYRSRNQTERMSPLEESSMDLEAFYLRKMLEQAFPEDGEAGLYGGGIGGDFYRSMFLDEMGRVWARKGGIGLRKRLLKDLERRGGGDGTGRGNIGESAGAGTSGRQSSGGGTR